MPIYNKPAPARLKRLEESDYITIKGEQKEITVVTKQETRSVIKELIEKECGPALIKATTNILSTFDTMIESNIKPEMNEKFSTMQKDVVAYIDFKIDILSQKICDMLITRKFNEEVDKRVNEKFEKLKTKGKF